MLKSENGEIFVVSLLCNNAQDINTKQNEKRTIYPQPGKSKTPGRNQKKPRCY